MSALKDKLKLREQDTAYWARGCMVIWPYRPKVCRHCERSFGTSEYRKVFCSDECKADYRKEYEIEYYKNHGVTFRQKEKIDKAFFQQFDETVD